MEDDQQFCLRWNNHQSTLISVFDTLLENQTLVDCTLAAEGQFLKAHKVVLSACSPFFADLLQQQYDKHPIFILKDVKYQELRAMMDYMYRGEVNISQDQLAALLKTAESLQIKGLSDNRSGSTPKTEQHRGLNVHGSGSGGKLSVYTLEQTQPKRPRVGPSPMETTDISGSREGSSSPSRRRKKARRKSAENAMSADVHDNSNSSQINQSSLQPHQQQPQANASLTGVGAITAATSSLPVSASALSTGTSGVLAATGSIVSTQGTTQQMTTNITKKTESVKGASDAMHTENIQAVGVVGTGDEQNVEHVKGEKSNHKQKPSTAGVTGKETADLVIEPKSEYEEEGNEETVEDLTLDDEEMGIEDLDHNAGTSQAGEGSSQGYAPWQHDRSQDELLLAPQETQQRDPQVKHDKSEQTDITPEEFELDDCLLESNDIVITQNKDGFVLHVKKLGNITTAKIAPTDEDPAVATNVADLNADAHITDVQHITDVKPTLTTLTTSQIKLPSSECELINLKKIIPATTTIASHQPAATIIQPHQFSQQPHPSQHHQQHGHGLDQQQHQQQHQIQQLQSHPQVQSIVTTHPPHTQTINLMGLRNVQIADQKPVTSRIKYSRGKIITPQSTTAASVQIAETHEVEPQHHQQLTEGTKYEISEIDLNNPSASAAIISDLVKYAEIDDIELPDGTKIGIGFAPTEITEHIQSTAPPTTQVGSVDEDSQQGVHHHHHHVQHLQVTQVHQMHPQTHHTQLQLQEQDDATTSVEATILPDGITLHEQPTITKSYTILTTRPIKQEGSASIDGTTTTTYELSLSDSSMHPDDGESKYVCRHCGKKYRWKSTLRRHENVECGGKEPCHPCPHCSYKAKQRGNLGVHVRKHHPDKPALESKRGRK
ncbi:longitudinals lacking protein, isoforms F/I/K/T isoform X1 [Anastrepha obliqua]|uniref:longitudinals lacking protein, isoforms F/I/K/T isoform X1 n=1 Tax=Anastrepha obliqua TaxID=95512 RepID=UPI00240A4087|nr:longitudinals lacking protein, isoforms F/I/K/T isoform X1 [Anastrepha obliqua]